jgi:hypothetical protein
MRQLSDKRALIASTIGFLTWCWAFTQYDFPAGSPYVVLASQTAYGRFGVMFLQCSDSLLWFGCPFMLAWVILGAGKSDRGREKPASCQSAEEPSRRNELYVTAGMTSEKCSVKIPAGGLYCGLMAIGATGSGKTSSWVLPILRELLHTWADDTDRRIGGLVLGVKANLWRQVCGLMGQAGRQDQCLELGPDSQLSYNPLASNFDSIEKAWIVMDILEQVDGKGKEPFWRQASEGYITNIIEMLMLARGWATLRDVYRYSPGNQKIDEIFQEAQDKVDGKPVYWFTAAQYDHARKTLDKYGAVKVGDRWRVEGSVKLYRYMDNKKWLPALGTPEMKYEGGSSDAEAKERLESVKFWLEHELPSLSREMRASVRETFANRLRIFDKPEVWRRFCPAKDDPNLIPRFEDLIEQGILVGINFPPSKNHILSRIVGVMAKRDFQQAVLNRIKPEGKVERPVVFCSDEYQVFATAGDPDVYGQSREALLIPIVAFHSATSMQASIGDACEALLEHFRSKFFLSLADTRTVELAEKLCGKDWYWRQTINLGETGQRAVLSGGNKVMATKAGVSGSISRAQQLESRYQFREFTERPTGQCIALVFDGVRTHPPQVLELRQVA